MLLENTLNQQQYEFCMSRSLTVMDFTENIFVNENVILVY